MNILDILQKCIDELDSTTKEEFEDKKKEMELQDKKYNKNEYTDEDVEVL